MVWKTAPTARAVSRRQKCKRQGPTPEPGGFYAFYAVNVEAPG
jgi:hypothetical protein